MADLKLDTLIKILLMTTSDTDGEALAALRAANKMLRAAHTDWDKLLRGKVTVVADPFADIPPPKTTTSYTKPQPPTPPSKPQPPRQQTYASRQTYTSPQQNTNQYAGHCFCCDTHVPVAMGALRVVPSYGTKIFCEDCNMNLANGSTTMSEVIIRHTKRQQKTTQASQPKPTYQPRPKRKVTTADLMKDIDI